RSSATRCRTHRRTDACAPRRFTSSRAAPLRRTRWPCKVPFAVVRINPEKKEDRERVAQELLRVTLRLANEHGFVSLGLREVSRAAEIAPTLFYRHFADMEELGRALIDGLAGPFIDGWIDAAKTVAGAERRVLAIAAQALAETSRDPELMRFVL